MDLQQFPAKQLSYVAVMPDDYDPAKRYPMIIMLHGFGSHMHDLAPLAELIHPTGYIYVCPNAPLQFQLGPGQLGFGWTPPRNLNSPEHTRASAEQLGEFFQHVFAKYNTEPGKAVLLGFSQGGGMTFRCGLPRPDAFAGIIALCSVVPEEDELRARLPAMRSQRVFMAYGERDQLIAPERAFAAQRFLQTAGYPLTFKGYPMGHELTPQVIEDLREWIYQTLPPLGASQLIRPG
jgi:phospholipase/carboxylesterase